MDYAAVPTETTTSHEVDLGLHPEYQHDETAYLAPHNEETYPQSDGSPYLYNDETSYLGRRSDSVELTGKHEFSEDDDQGLHFKPSLLLSLVALALTYVGESIAQHMQPFFLKNSDNPRQDPRSRLSSLLPEV